MHCQFKNCLEAVITTVWFWLFWLPSLTNAAGILYPQDSESREVKSLDGIWSFRTDGGNGKPLLGFKEQWYKQELRATGEIELMPVPSSYNDVSQSKDVRDHIGWAWYQTKFWTPSRWTPDDLNVFLRFGSANYFAVVWVNGEHVMNHTGGHLPFSGEITTSIVPGSENLLVVALNNTLGPVTIPQGTLRYETDETRFPKGFTSQSYNFDYFHYAGIHRPVYVFTTPKYYIKDITITTAFLNNSQPLGIVNYDVRVGSAPNDNTIYESTNTDCVVVVRDAKDRKIVIGRECSGTLEVPGVQMWWPYTHQPEGEKPGYLYTLEVHLTTNLADVEEDVYRLKFGIRTIEYDDTDFKINGKPFYFRGFGRHEDYSVRGRGVDSAMIVKDHNLIQWTGANSYRTSHYPYAEEILDLADRLGIVIIDESPAIGLSGYGNELLTNHLQVMEELITRDKNRASVIMWSLGNEPKSMQLPSTLYFEKVIAATKRLDPGDRPITIVLSEGFPANVGPRGLDVYSINRYFGWYGNTGRPEVIRLQMPLEVKTWNKHYNKPVIVTEYGAGSIAGMHQNPSFVWTEDYQVEYLNDHFKSFDQLRNETNYFIGEMIWNFADFATPPETIRPWGCMKGVFTRERQPKHAAHLLRRRYWNLAHAATGCTLPDDLQ